MPIIVIVSGSGSTAQNIIDRAMRLIGQLEAGQSADTSETADCLVALNAMFESWRNERLMCYALQDESVPLASGNTTRTVGPSGDYLTTRPLRIESAYVVYGSISIPVRVIEADEYAGIADKTSTATYPEVIYYEATMPDGTIYMYPLPSGSSTLHIFTRRPLESFASASTAVEMPPGWDDALAFNLAVRIAPEFETVASAEVKDTARATKAALKSLNSRPIKAKTELNALMGRRVSNIITGA